jgi:phage virion morphogenesis protein
MASGSLINVQVNLGEAGKRVDQAAQQLKDGRSLFRTLAGTLEAETEANFAAQGRPSWVPLSAATRRDRLKRNQGSSILKILQDSGTLAASISSYYGSDFAVVGAGGAAKDYAGIQHFGGTIERPAYSVKTRLRTDAKGTLLRQGTEGRAKNLAVFAKDSHKRVQESWSTVEAFKVDIPARPYLPFSGPPGGATLQPAAEQSVLDVVMRALQLSLG